MKRYIQFSIFILLVGNLSLAAENMDWNKALVFNPYFFAYNAEIKTPYKYGETIMGSSIESFMSLNSKNIILNLGVYGKLYYGDEDFLSEVKPIISVTYYLQDALYFTMGTLYNENRHGMLDALVSELLEYQREIDYGFQLRMKNKYLYNDGWINWNLLDTPEHREYLDFGDNFYLYLGNFIFNFQGYWSHHGGEIHFAGPQIDYWNMAIGLENFYDINNSVLNRIGFKTHYIKNSGRSKPGKSTDGDGILSEVYCQLGDFRIFFDYWHESLFEDGEFVTEEGNPLYQHDDWIFYGVEQKSRINDQFDFQSEVKLHYFLDTGKSSFEIAVEIIGYLEYPFLGKEGTK
jgi:hypothetical protein